MPAVNNNPTILQQVLHQFRHPNPQLSPSNIDTTVDNIEGIIENPAMGFRSNFMSTESFIDRMEALALTTGNNNFVLLARHATNIAGIDGNPNNVTISELIDLANSMQGTQNNEIDPLDYHRFIPQIPAQQPIPAPPRMVVPQPANNNPPGDLGEIIVEGALNAWRLLGF